jgi:hypothetical protein
LFHVPVAAVLSVLSVVALSYLWLGGRCEALGRELKELEAERANLHRVAQHEEYRWARMCAPLSIERALRRYGIRMSWPDKDRIVRLHRSDLLGDERPAGGRPDSDEPWRDGYTWLTRTEVE